jgi:hypothetical protein
MSAVQASNMRETVKHPIANLRRSGKRIAAIVALLLAAVRAGYYYSMNDYKAIMERIAEEFPLPAQPQHHSDETHQGTGAWDNDTMEDWLRTIGEQHSWFAYEKTNRRDGWRS